MSAGLAVVLLLIVVGAGLMAWGLQRELARHERERQLREWLATSDQMRELAEALVQLRLVVADRLSPSLQQAAQAAARLAEAFNVGPKR